MNATKHAQTQARGGPPTLFAVAIVAVLLAACAAPPPAAATSPVATSTARPSPSGPPDKVSLRLDFTPTGSHAAFHFALERGFYRDENLDVTIGDGQTSANTAQVIASKGDTFGWADAAVVALNISRGVPVIVVADVLQQTATLVISRESAGIRTPKDLEGKSLGVTFGGSAEQLFTALVKANGVNETTIKRVNMASTVQPAAFLSGQVDAVVTSLGTALTIQSQAQTQNITTRLMRFSEHGVNVLAHGIIVHRDMLAQQPDVVRRFVRASLRGWEEAAKDPAGATQAMVKNRPTVNPTVIRAQLDGFLTMHRTAKTQGRPLGWQSADDWAAMLDFLATYSGMTDRKPIETYFTNDYLPAQ